jgi:hypothetical protein
MFRPTKIASRLTIEHGWPGLAALSVRAMTVTHTPGSVSRFRRTPWRFQQTVETDERSGMVIATAIAERRIGIQEVTIIIDKLVVDSPLSGVLSPAAADSLTHNSTVSTTTPDEVTLLVSEAFTYNAFDFILIPRPKPFVVYSDHDGFVTFYANTKSHLNRIIDLLTAQGVKLVRDWKREL